MLSGGELSSLFGFLTIPKILARKSSTLCNNLIFPLSDFDAAPSIRLKTGSVRSCERDRLAILPKDAITYRQHFDFHSLYRGQGTDRHERRHFDCAVRGLK